MFLKIIGRTVVGGAILVAMAACMPGTARAQTAYDLNRANQALQICMSPMGASIPECSQLKGQFGVGGAPAAAGAPAGGAAGILGALAGARGGNAAGVAGLLGALANNAGAAKANAPVAPTGAAAAQQAYAACVANAGVNTVAIQGCSSIVANWTGGVPAAPAPASAPVGSGDYYVQSANATQAAAAGYQACVAANPTNWQPCMAILTGGAPAQVPAAPVGPPVGLNAVAMAGYNRCITTNPGQEAKCAAAYGAVPGPQAGVPAAPNGTNAITNAANAAQTARSLAPTVKALGSLLGR